MKIDNKVQEFLTKHPSWRGGLETLRDTLNQLELEETIKWGVPVYCVDNKNVVGLVSCKAYFGLWFFNGALLKDDGKVLVNAQEGKTKGMRHWRFGRVNELPLPLVKQYCREAIDNQRAGRVIRPVQKQPLELPELLRQALADDPQFNDKFYQLSPGKQREYAEYISSAKRDVTQQTRLQKSRALIHQGVGLNDKYRKC